MTAVVVFAGLLLSMCFSVGCLSQKQGEVKLFVRSDQQNMEDNKFCKCTHRVYVQDKLLKMSLRDFERRVA